MKTVDATAVPSAIPTRPEKPVLRLAQNFRVDGKRALHVSHRILPEHHHLLRSSLPGLGPDCRHDSSRNCYVHKHNLGRKLPNRTNNEPLHMDPAPLRMGKRRILVHFPLHLRRTKLRPRRQRLQDSHRSSRPSPNLLEHDIARDRRLQSTIPRAYIFPKVGESSRSSRDSRDQVLQEAHSRSQDVEGRKEQGPSLDQNRVHSESRCKDQAAEGEIEQEVFDLE